MTRDTAPANDPLMREIVDSDKPDPCMDILVLSVTVKTSVLYGVMPMSGESRPLNRPRAPSLYMVARHTAIMECEMFELLVCMRTRIVSKGWPAIVPAILATADAMICLKTISTDNLWRA